MSFVYTQSKCQTVLFDSLIAPFQMLPLWAGVDQGEMAMKGYSTFPKVAALMKPYHQIVLCHIQDTYLGESYPSAEKQSVYSTAPADWATVFRISFNNTTADNERPIFS